MLIIPFLVIRAHMILCKAWVIERQSADLFFSVIFPYPVCAFKPELLTVSSEP